MGELLVVSAIAIAVVMLATWLISLAIADVSIVDIVWGLGFVVSAWATYLATDSGSRGLLLTLLVTAWGLRLTVYLAKRNIGEDEDRRYRKMREDAGRHFWIISLLKVFAFQGLLMWVISIPVTLTQTSGSPLYWIDYVAVAVWGVGLFFEAVGDYQMAKFKARPGSAGEVMDRGLWRYTRHPNYFGDFTVWWGHYLVALAAGGWWTIFSPLVMSFLLLRFSGVTMLEKNITSRRPGYEEYVERTNTFFPGPRSSG